MKTRILLVDDHPVFLQGIISILGSNLDMDVIGQAGNGNEAVNMALELKPDVIVMDITMPDMDGITATKKILEETNHTKILALSIHSGKRFIKEMLNAGASGYLLKDSAPEELVNAINKIVEGHMYLSPSITSVALSTDDENADTVNETILFTKLHRPSVSDEFILREKIIDTLESNIDKPLSLICAPAGYGKSIAVSQWLESTKYLHTWISLDEELDDLRIFLSYFNAAINKIFPGKLSKTKAILEAAELPPQKVLTATLINDLDTINQEFILVLDDFQKIHNREILSIINELLHYPPDNMHLTIIGRRDPALNLSELKLHQRITQIRMKQLAFSEEEMARVITKYCKIPLKKEITADIFKKTEGWIVGLRLALMNLDDSEEADKVLMNFSNDLYSVSHFLIEEVLEKQPGQIQDMLLVSSLFDRFCWHILEDFTHSENDQKGNYIKGEEFIQWLINSNLFLISLDKENHWFRYHHLFQDLLKSQLKKRKNPDEIKSLHLKASEWFVTKNLIEEAIHHALLSGKPERAAEIVEQVRMKELESDRWYLIERWLSLIPEEILLQRPIILLTRAWIYYQQTKILEIVEILDQIELLQKEEELDNNLSSELAFFKGTLLYFTGDAEKSLTYLWDAYNRMNGTMGVLLGEVEIILGLALQMNGQEKKAIELLEGSTSMAGSKDTMYLTRAIAGLGYIHSLSADMNKAKNSILGMHKAAKKTGSIYALSWSEYMLASVYFHSNKVEEALTYFKEVVAKRYISDMGVSVNAYIGLVLSYQALRREQEASETMDQMVKFVNEMNDPPSLSMVHSCRARLALVQGDLAFAGNWVSDLDLSPDPLSLFIWLDSPFVTKARVLITQGTAESLTSAAKLLKSLREMTESLHIRCHLIEVLVLETTLHLKQENYNHALQVLKKAVLLSEPGGFLSPFIEHYEQISSLLEQLQEQNTAADFILRIKKLIHESSQIKPNASGVIIKKSKSINSAHLQIEPISQRESEILELVAKGFRNKEIGAKLFISENTVKKHLFNTFQKFGVKNRISLIEKATEAGVLER